MRGWDVETLKVNGIDIHCTRTGGNKPPVILLHGLTADGACWSDLANAIAGEYDVIMPDARGHGKSRAPDSGHRYDDLASDVIGLIDVLGLSFPILVGHSMGGLTAALVASRISRRLRGLILADPTFLSPSVQHEIYVSDVLDRHRKILNQSLDEVIAEVRAKHPHRRLDTVEHIARARLQTRPAAFGILRPPNPEFRPLVSAIDVPSLLVIGDQGNVVTLALAEELQRLNQKLQVQQIQKASHGLHYDQPDQFENAVKIFLRSLGHARKAP